MNQPLTASRAGAERRLGHSFNTPALFAQALTHRSFASPHNERLEFLGDSVLNCLIAEALYERFHESPEGDLSRLRANLVNQASLAEIAASLDLGPLLRLGDGELKSGGALRPSILADALEAVIGAVFLDAGFEKARQVVLGLYAERLQALRDFAPTKDSKTQLQEVLQGKRLATPRYSVLRIEGEAHRQHFVVRCDVPALNLDGEGEGASRKAAEQAAAAKVLAKLG